MNPFAAAENGDMFNGGTARMVPTITGTSSSSSSSPPQNFKGFKVLAMKPLAAGTLVCSERPVVFVPANAGGAAVGEDLLIKTIQLAVGTWISPEHGAKNSASQVINMYPANCSDATNRRRFLHPTLWHLASEASKDLFSTLCDDDQRWLKTLTPKRDPIASILRLMIAFRFNLIAAYDASEQIKIGDALCVAASFFGHSCYPNTCVYYDEMEDRMICRVITDVAEGTELTISYASSLYAYTDERRRDLQQNFGFVCACARCENRSPSELDLSPPLLRPANDKLEQKLQRTAKAVCKNYLREVREGEEAHKRSVAAARIWLNEANGYYSPLHPMYFKIIEFLAMTIASTDPTTSIVLCDRVLQQMDYVYPYYWYRKHNILNLLCDLYGQQQDVDADVQPAFLKAKKRLNDLLRVCRGGIREDDTAAPTAAENEEE